MIPAERALIGLAISLINDKRHLTTAERLLKKHAAKCTRDDTETTRAAILAGDDPLGDEFCRVRSPKSRRLLGATYTPTAVVDVMIAWAASQSDVPKRVVDPGAGSGRFLMAAARKFSNAELVAVEIDPLASLLLRANAAVLGFTSRLKLHNCDYRELKLPITKGPTLFIGNPPYVRHHDIGEAWKDWLGTEAAKQGFKASKLAGLHVHFS